MDDTPNNAKDPTAQGSASIPGSPNQSDPDLVTPAISGEEGEGASAAALESDDDTLLATQSTGGQPGETTENPQELDSSHNAPGVSSDDSPLADTGKSDTSS